ncbi:hypothetical protein VNO78_16389 [Psophocarpus tetragonolobus]|uniref:Uncharacterized protein n=1 Tax=Psophocarpus tetragonolobus TaxID=3891 RepID=A0AAN9XKR2_PSOTE
MKMRFLAHFVALILFPCWFVSVRAEEIKSPQPCDFKALFNFGDSNSDTGCMASAFYPEILPYGETFFHEPVGRASDGRLIIDFIAQHLGFPFLSAYIDSIGTSYRHGANFAAGSSTIMRQNRTVFQGGTPFTFEIQVAQFNQFKNRTAKFFNQEKENSFTKDIPRPEDYAKAIYTFDIGQNDIAAVISQSGMEYSHAVISEIVDNFTSQVQYLHELGARTFWIHNTGPIGCLPVAMPVHNAKNQSLVAGYLDLNGCVNYQNDMAREFNKKLKNTVVKLRSHYPDASLIYVDMFSAKYELISNANKEGFVDPSKICCGYHENGHHVYCSNRAIINGKEIVPGSCDDPSKYISWDGVHYTEAANYWIANRIVNGSFSDPPLSIAQSCHA